MRGICELVLEGESEPRADEAQIRFSRAFGELEIHPEADQRSSRHPEIFRVANTEETGHIRSADDPVDVYLKIAAG
jgi:alpha-ketoglutarate-dependent taurine dioxygenase